jgi:hypothetical protein
VVDGKIKLHKSQTGVKIAVPVEKLAVSDLRYLLEQKDIPLKSNDQKTIEGELASLIKEKNNDNMQEKNDNMKEKNAAQEKNEMKPLDAGVPNGTSKMNTTHSLVTSKPPTNTNSTVLATDPAYIFNGFDWYQYLHQSCSIDSADAQRYARSFVQEKMDQSTLAHLDRDLLKEMSIASGDIIRILSRLEKPINSTLNFNSTSGGVLTKQQQQQPMTPKDQLLAM